MGKYSVEITTDARKHLQKIRKSGDKQLIKKIEKIFIELSENPYIGEGKPEQLRYLPGMWSRRLDKKNRLRYMVNDDIITVFVVSALGHYDDK